jgi:hypothetical protein
MNTCKRERKNSTNTTSSVLWMSPGIDVSAAKNVEVVLRMNASHHPATENIGNDLILFAS